MTALKAKSMGLWLIAKKNWWLHFLLVAVISISGVVWLGYATYDGAPPVASFALPGGQVVVTKQQIVRGKEVFHLRGLMNYGSFMGDGAERGPDFTALALHNMVESMRSFYEGELSQKQAMTQHDRDAISARIKRELHENRFDSQRDQVELNPAQALAFEQIKARFARMFTDPTDPDAFHPIGFISKKEDLDALSAFFFWGAWVCAANRPGETYSYTQNWPPDLDAGNSPTLPTFFWSVLSIFALFLGIGAVLYVYGQIKTLPGSTFDGVKMALSTEDLEAQLVRPTQRATYKFFVFAMILFLVQVLVGILAANDFVRADKTVGIDLPKLIPFNIARSLHLTLQIFWFFVCWIGYTVFLLPRVAHVPKGQKGLINLLFGGCVLVGAGVLFGLYAGPFGYLGDSAAYWFGSQGWEFMEPGRVWQILLLGAFVLWILIIYRGVKPWLRKANLWSVPAWLLYGSGIMVAFLFFGLLVTPSANFAISDYWRWMVVHMWVEATFEVFTTVVVGYLLVQMGLITRPMAERVIFLAVMLFLVTALVGISHNFYWIAKPSSIIALGSVFSTLQVLPLILLTLDAWKMRQEGKRALELQAQGKQVLVMDGVWLFVLAVNFWNIFGAGVFGSLINLPIVNYYEHATYLTGNHAHGAMFGVKGNVAIAGMLFCCQHLFRRETWNPKLIRIIFWSLNVGVALMMFLDLFPVGLYQLTVCMTRGLWYARSAEVVQSTLWKTLTYARSVGGMLFTFGGVIPLVWFVLSRGRALLPEKDSAEGEWTAYEKDWSAE